MMAATAGAVFENLVPPQGEFLVVPPNLTRQDQGRRGEGGQMLYSSFRGQKTTALGWEMSSAGPWPPSAPRRRPPAKEMVPTSNGSESPMTRQASGSTRRRATRQTRQEGRKAEGATHPECPENDVDIGSESADQLEAVMNHAYILRNAQPAGEPSRAQLA